MAHTEISVNRTGPGARLAIMAAMPQELAGLVQAMGDTLTTQRVAMRDFYLGFIAGQPCVVVLSRIGKVAAAATTAILIEKFGATDIVFAGLAGGIHPSVRIGDVVVASSLMQHDLDARPLFDQYEVPMLGLKRFEPDLALSLALLDHTQAYLQSLPGTGVDPQATNAASPPVAVPGARLTDDPAPRRGPRAHRGAIATGDIFVHDPEVGAALQRRLPDVLCVEMEGAAMAQVCYEFGIPYAVMRVISDHADPRAKDQFTDFLQQKAGLYTCGVLLGLLASRAAAPAVHLR